ncbi:hypothetical protein [Mycobacterium sp. 3519A]|uniref:hypothetical protein n=1 Tax=Mycobacterium sp. 3519A TaxID=2057184 RepID=UPI001F3CD9AB|nr:hypothetical protein [Mycobacterium sp. 3519A]
MPAAADRDPQALGLRESHCLRDVVGGDFTVTTATGAESANLVLKSPFAVPYSGLDGSVTRPSMDLPRASQSRGPVDCGVGALDEGVLQPLTSAPEAMVPSVPRRNA